MHSPQYRPCALIAHSVRRAQVEYGGGHVKQKMINNLVRLLQTDPGRVNVKARTHEKVDAVGECRALECHVVLTLERDPTAVLAKPPAQA